MLGFAFWFQGVDKRKVAEEKLDKTHQEGLLPPNPGLLTTQNPAE